VKLFLEQFGVKTCVVNAELPLASRYHVVEEFNRGVYEVVVATDEGVGAELELEPEPKAVRQAEDDADAADHVEDTAGAEQDKTADEVAKAGPEDGEESEEKQDGEGKPERTGDKSPANGDQGEPPVEISAVPSKTKHHKRPSPNSNPPSRKRRRADPASSLARGIDFTSASSVINFDLPTTTTAYMHRVGRTARAGHSGLALSFVVPRDQWGKDKVASLKSARDDEVVWERIRERVREEGGGEMKEWDLGGRRGEVEGFRYRVEGGMRAVTGKRVAEARREEVRRELLNSEKLKVCLNLTLRYVSSRFKLYALRWMMILS